MSLLLLSCGDVESNPGRTIDRISISALRARHEPATRTSSQSGLRASNLFTEASSASKPHKSVPAVDNFGVPRHSTPGRVVWKSSVPELQVRCVNSRFVVNKMALIHNAIDELRLDILAITETWIRADHLAAIKSDLAPPGFTVLHAHRPSDRNGGGVVIVAKETQNARSISLSGSYSSFEFLVVQLTVKTGHLNFVSIYRPPQTSSFFNDFINFLDKVIKLSGGLYICGDTNCPSTMAGRIDQHLEQVI